MTRDLALGLAVAVLLLVVAAVLASMWVGWRRRGRRHLLPPLPVVRADAAEPVLTATGRYFGSTVCGDWLDRVVARGLGTRSPVELSLRGAGIDVERPAGSFAIPVESLRAARHDQGIAGKVVPPHGILVVTWQHGDVLLDSGFRLDDSDRHADWIDAVDQLTKERHG